MSVEKKINDIKGRVMTMADRSGRAIEDSVKSLIDRDDELAESIVKNDRGIDRMESEIDAECMELFKERLSGHDLRTAASTYRIISELERIGDYSVSIANVTMAVSNKPLLGTVVEITDMSKVARGMLGSCMDSYLEGSRIGLEPFFNDDRKIDDLYNKVFLDSLGSILEEPQTATNNIYMIIAARALERIGDHIINIVERVSYIETGRLIERDVPMHVPARTSIGWE